MKYVKTSITRCARCEGTHLDIILKELTKPIIYQDDKVIYTHFTICPTTEEPILALVELKE